MVELKIFQVAILLTLTLFLALPKPVYPDKILVLSFVSSKSHKITYMPLIEELARRGHQITVLSPVKPFKGEIANIKEILTFDAEAVLEEDLKLIFGDMSDMGKARNPLSLLDIIIKGCRMTYDLDHVKGILKQDFDLVFMQPLFNDCALGIVYRLKAPLVLFFPNSAPSFLVEKIGGYYPPSVTANTFLGYGSEMSFFERFVNFGVNLAVGGIIRWYYEPMAAQIYRDKLGADIPDVKEILGNASLILSNGHFSMGSPKTNFPDVVEVGGIHSRPAQKLPKNLEDFVSGPDGFIYFSLGSAVQASQMPEEKRKLFLNVFSKLKQKVVWKWETEKMDGQPANVILSKWLPQQDLLGHKGIKMFITHCGGGGTEEAVYHGVPLIGMPLFGDQMMNAANAKQKGYLVQVDWASLTEEQLMNAIQEVLKNNRYEDNVKKLSKLFRDQPDEPLNRGAYWVEYILRHKGAMHLRTAGRKLNYFQYHSLDVIGAYLALLSVLSYIVWVILKRISRIVCGYCFGNNKNNVKHINKKNQ